MKTTEIIEYSEDYQFFKENQIAISYSMGRQKAVFFSLLEKRMFFEVTSTGTLDDYSEEYYCKMAHRHVIIEQSKTKH